MAPTPADLRALTRARDLMDRRYVEPLDVPAIAASVHMSAGHFHRSFREAFGETPYAYLMTRRIERAMMLLRTGTSVTDACFAVGCTSLGSFSSSFTRLVGATPSAYRAAAEAGDHDWLKALPGCVAKTVSRPMRSQPAVRPPGPA
ncbi:helix-turn-helix transcriptional regulator [Nocardioides jejuensis]|uniref:AraC family transcriptional regulator n=1 Tax=Nocardioides jejuensis TaxID=2502782 RepID=A0A4V2NXR2_9ACTN|nr:helix-turn-helix transcriptional regulator [Nocardioides jejuensis]TCJ22272.1 AraC family transcriptional regulator [Nocardioides jejuensis]